MLMMENGRNVKPSNHKVLLAAHAYLRVHPSQVAGAHAGHALADDPTAVHS